MKKNTFARELDQLIRKHLDGAEFGEDFEAVAIALHRAAIEIDERADRHPGARTKSRNRSQQG